MGYDVELIILKLKQAVKFPVSEAGKLLAECAQPLEAEAVRKILLEIPGCKPGPDDSVDYLGAGLSYARMTVKPKAIFVENNCGPKDLLKMQAALQDKFGPVFIYDLQSRQLHDAESFKAWWSKPL